MIRNQDKEWAARTLKFYIFFDSLSLQKSKCGFIKGKIEINDGFEGVMRRYGLTGKKRRCFCRWNLEDEEAVVRRRTQKKSGNLCKLKTVSYAQDNNRRRDLHSRLSATTRGAKCPLLQRRRGCGRCQKSLLYIYRYYSAVKKKHITPFYYQLSFIDGSKPKNG